MYKTYEDAKRAALEVIGRIYQGGKMNCVVTERKLSEDDEVWFGFRFYGDDTNGKFVRWPDGTYNRCTRI